MRFPVHSFDFRPDILDGFEQNQATLVGEVAIDCTNFPAEDAVNWNS